MPKAIVMHETGGPDCLRWEDVAVGDPGPGEVRIRQTAVGLNYIDVYVRTGAYPLLQLPGTLRHPCRCLALCFNPGLQGFMTGL